MHSQDQTSQANSDWRARERLVAMLEKCLSPDAQIQHDVRLPVLGRSRTRQCDVVLRFGKAPRDSLTIVEVQKRNRRPDITTFHGWVAKMREVGAQQLICVSSLGYPQSIVDEVATRLGPTVKLLRLEDLAKGATLSPFHLFPNLLETKPKFSVVDLGPLRIEGPVPMFQMQLRLDEQVFSVEAEEQLISLDELIARALNATDEIALPPPHEMANWSKTVTANIDSSHQVKFHHDGKALHVANLPVSVRITLDSRLTPIPVHELRYSQESLDGELAWVTRTTLQQQDRQVEITIVVKPDKDGFLKNIQTFCTFA